MTIDQVYDELYGAHDNLKQEVNNIIAQIKEVSFSPTVESGTKLGDLVVGAESSAIYAPEVSYTPAVESGTKLGDLVVGAESSAIFAPAGSNLISSDTVILVPGETPKTATVYLFANGVKLFKVVDGSIDKGLISLTEVLPDAYRPYTSNRLVGLNSDHDKTTSADRVREMALSTAGNVTIYPSNVDGFYIAAYYI